MRKILAIVVLIFLALTSVSSAAVQKIEADGSYQIGEFDSISIAKQGARNDALRNAAEKAGVLVQARTEMKNYKITEDEVITKATKLFKVESCHYTQEYINETLIIYAHVVVTVDENELIKDLTEKLDNTKKIIDYVPDDLKDSDVAGDLYLNYVLISNGDYAKAMFNLSSLIKSRNGVVPARIYYLRSVAYFDLEKYNEALDDIKKAIHMDGKYPLYHVQEGMIRLAISQLYIKWRQYSEAKGQYLMAESKCNTALELKGHYWPAFYCRAIARHLNENLRKSVNDAENAIKHGGRGVSYVEHFDGYINAQYRGRHRNVSRENIINLLKEGVNGLMEVKDYRKKNK